MFFDVVKRAVAHIQRDSRGACEVRELGENIVRRCAALNCLEVSELFGRRVRSCRQGSDTFPDSVVPAVDQEVEVSQQVHPMIGSWTSATTKHQVNSRRRPSVRVCHPYVGMGEVVAGAHLVPWDEPSGNNAEVGLGVDKAPNVVSVGDEYAAGSCRTGICRHQRLLLLFSCFWK